MTARPEVPGPDTGSYEVIHPGGQAAVVVPVADFLRLRARKHGDGSAYRGEPAGRLRRTGRQPGRRVPW